MKMTLRMILPAVAALVLLGNSAMAQTKIATVNVNKLFAGYYKTKLAQADIDQRRQQIQKDEDNSMDDLKKANTDYQQLLTESDDQALSSDERSQKKQDADAKYKEIQDLKSALDQYDRSARANLGESLQRVHDKIVSDIEAHVATVAKAGGYTIVLDTSAQTAANTPMLIYSSDEVDLTDQVLKQLNDGAPIDMSTSGSSASPLSTPPALNTNSP